LSELAEHSTYRARVLRVSKTLEETIGLLWGQAAVEHCCLEACPGVPNADVSHHVVEVARPIRPAQPFGFLLGESTGLDHLVGAPHQTLTAPCSSLALRAFIHRP
jgi:hypothetical protein